MIYRKLSLVELKDYEFVVSPVAKEILSQRFIEILSGLSVARDNYL
ncbi:MAG: hypothetical protein F6J86_14475 [Symploca sp. SIO1B1]|nr:hypothetical protein [Symploca sp. SIO1B1]